MDHKRFDALARTLTAASSRRRFAQLLARCAVGSLLGAVGLGRAEAKKHKRHKKHHHPTPPPATECQALFEGALCGGRGCKVCHSGECVVDASRERAICGSDACLVCQSGVCTAAPTDDDACGVDGTGRCYLGECVSEPTCEGAGSPICFSQPASGCCSGQCNGEVCAAGGTGFFCRVAEDCTSKNCIGYHCQ
jgi:hypothetical protein